MIEVKEFVCSDKFPTLMELMECVDIAWKDNCIVNLRWRAPYDEQYKNESNKWNTVPLCLKITGKMTTEDCVHDAILMSHAFHVVIPPNLSTYDFQISRGANG